MFSQFLAHEQSRLERLAAIPEPLRQPEEIFRTADKGRGLEAEDAASLFAAARDRNCRNEIQAAANRVRAGWAAKTVEFIIPVYLTSFCRNECLYCGYRQSNPIAERIRLNLEDFNKQLDLILSWGHRQIELVLSDDPEFGPATVARYVAATRRKLEALGGGIVALCSPVYQQEDYVRLREAGLDWVVEWQETYDRPHFDRWHFAGSPKRNFESRLDLWDRVLAAGITKIGMGVLLGLYDFRCDALAVIEHGNYLRRAYGIEPHALGIPRMKPARGVLASQKPNRFTVCDDDFRLVVSVYHLAFPTSRLFFNTRESYDLNISLVAAGDLFTVDCETLPGAYLRRHLPGQFSTHDYPPRREVVATLEQRGLASKYLAPEMPCEVAPTAPATGAALDEKRWMEQHAQVRVRLRDWEMALEQLSSDGSRGLVRRAADASLGDILDYFKTVLTTHCRQEESELFPAFRRDAEVASKLAAFRAEHERFGVDLDKFERQMVSYGLSKDPTVLLTLGARIIREMRSHLEAEEQLLPFARLRAIT
ncbi:MAG TPA: hemerythrin domain-containing protein [Candidatus Sulfotelmatobacter sp.]|nr:hemerythrin domain-containing protein [Candidatus Sulfotelmatobacter sp.]